MAQPTFSICFNKGARSYFCYVDGPHVGSIIHRPEGPSVVNNGFIPPNTATMIVTYGRIITLLVLQPIPMHMIPDLSCRGRGVERGTGDCFMRTQDIMTAFFCRLFLPFCKKYHTATYHIVIVHECRRGTRVYYISAKCMELIENCMKRMK